MEDSLPFPKPENLPELNMSRFIQPTGNDRHHWIFKHYIHDWIPRLCISQDSNHKICEARVQSFLLSNGKKTNSGLKARLYTLIFFAHDVNNGFMPEFLVSENLKSNSTCKQSSLDVTQTIEYLYNLFKLTWQQTFWTRLSNKIDHRPVLITSYSGRSCIGDNFY